MNSSVTINDIEKSIVEAARILPIVWPLKSSIAINPLWDLRDKSFEQALKEVQKYLPVRGYLSQKEYLELYINGGISNAALKKAVGEYQALPDEGVEEFICKLQLMAEKVEINSFKSEPHWVVPAILKEKIINFLGLYFEEEENNSAAFSRFPLWNKWKQTVEFDNNWTSLLHHLPLDVMPALQMVLEKLQIKKEELTELFRFSFTQLIGWHGFIKWLESRKNNPLVKQKGNLIEITLIWCSCLYVEGIKPSQFLSVGANSRAKDQMLKIWQRAYELSYQEGLLSQLKAKSKQKSKPIAQFVFCIDVRSEAIRRHLELVDDYETFGYAGFFGSIFSLEETSNNRCTLQAPALVEANIAVHKKNHYSMFSQFISQLSKVFKQAKENYFSTFAFFEMMGLWMILPLFQKTFLAKMSVFRTRINSTHTNPFLSPEHIENTVENMYSFLKTIGLTESFSRIVIVCGHQAKTTNNPFQASFDCGACGGNSGAMNATITCEILNNPEIRNRLQIKGINITDETRFVSACHETTTDRLTLETDLKNAYLFAIESDIQKALQNLKAERAASLPGCSYYGDRAYHFAELLPEWGLAKNAAMIIGPRSITEKIDLNSRVFLHSYEPEHDKDASILEGILSAPMVVAHWINSQYYFSATDPEIYGAGNKAIHNVISNIGVIEGNQGDLKIGLPRQSIFFRDKRIHEPLKLLVVIFANQSQLSLLFKRRPEIKSLFDLGWLNLQVINPGSYAYVTE